MKTNNTPGPGQYDGSKRQGAPSFTMGSKPGDRSQYLTPGPGAYEEKSSAVKDRSRDVKFGGTSREGLTSKDAASRPGPGMYDQQERSMGKSGPQFTISGKTNQKRLDESPGPGSYDDMRSLSRERGA